MRAEERVLVGLGGDDSWMSMGVKWWRYGLKRARIWKGLVGYLGMIVLEIVLVILSSTDTCIDWVWVSWMLIVLFNVRSRPGDFGIISTPQENSITLFSNVP